MCERISDDLSLHLLRVHSTAGSVVRRTYRGVAVRSNHCRSAAETEVLDRNERAVVVHELQGDLYFASMEAAFRSIVSDLDGHPVRRAGPAAGRSTSTAAASLLVQELVQGLAAAGRTLVLAHPSAPSSSSWARCLLPPVFPDVDAALEWCEGRLLGADPGLTTQGSVSLAEQPTVARRAPRSRLVAVEAAATFEEMPTGHVMVHEGEPADALYFVLSGRVSVRLAVSDGTRDRRLATFGPGMAFGETALVADGVRTADVVTDEPTQLAHVEVDALRRIGADDGGFMTTVYGEPRPPAWRPG